MRTITAAAALCLTLATGCTGAEDPREDESPSATPSDSPDTGTPAPEPSESGTAPADGPVVAFDAAAQTTFDESGVRDVAAGDDVVLTLTSDTLRGRLLPGLAEAWAVTSETGSFTDVWARPGTAWGVVLEVRTVAGTGTEVGYDEIAVRRIDLATGEVEGEASTRVPQDPRGTAGQATGRIVGVQGSRVVVDAAVADPGAVHATAVLDPATGRTAWRTRGAEALVSTPRLVVVSTGTPSLAGTVDARHLRTGKRRWRALPGTLTATAVGVGRRSVVIARDDNVFAEHTVTPLALRTGRAGTAQVTSDAEWSCEAATSSLAVCRLPDAEQVVGWNLERNRARWTLPTESRFAPIVTLVQDRLVYGVLGSGAGVVLEAVSGQDVKGAGGAAPKAVTAWGGLVHYGDRAIFVPVSAPGDPASTGSPSVPASPTASDSGGTAASESPSG